MKRGTTITIWKAGTLDKWGNPSYTVSTSKARWEDVSELYYGSDGRQYRSSSRVGVSVDLSVGDFITQGDYSNSSTPIDSASEVKDFKKIPNYNYKKYDRWAIV